MWIINAPNIVIICSWNKVRSHFYKHKYLHKMFASCFVFMISSIWKRYFAIHFNWNLNFNGFCFGQCLWIIRIGKYSVFVPVTSVFLVNAKEWNYLISLYRQNTKIVWSLLHNFFVSSAVFFFSLSFSLSQSLSFEITTFELNCLLSERQRRRNDSCLAYKMAEIDGIYSLYWFL